MTAWRTGDLAGCVRDDWAALNPTYQPRAGDCRKGGIYRVRNVGRHRVNGSIWLMIGPDGVADDDCTRWEAECFERLSIDVQIAA